MARDLIIRIVGDERQYRRSLDKASKATSDFKRSSDRTFRGVIAGSGAFSQLGRSVAFASTSFLAGAGLTAAFRSTVSAASNLNESINAVTVTFGAASDQVLEFSKHAAKDVGLSMRQLNELVTPLGASLQNYGLSANEAAQQSIELTKRASDMASVFNTDVSVALEAIQSALRGESDPIERFGVGLNEAAVQAEAMRLGLAKSTGEITAQDKTLARLSLIYQQTAKFQGDFARTSGGLANQTRIQSSEFENLQAKIGQDLVPAFQKFLAVALKLANLVAPAVILALKGLIFFMTATAKAVLGMVDIVLGGMSRLLGGVAELSGAIGGTFGRALGAIGINIGGGLTSKIESAQASIDGLRESIRSFGDESQKAGLQFQTAFQAVAGAITAAGAAVGPKTKKTTAGAAPAFQLPGPLRLQQARAQITQSIQDDVATAKKIKAFIEARIKAGTLKGQRLIDALGDLASAEGIIRSGLEKETSKRQDAARKEAEARKRHAEALQRLADRFKQAMEDTRDQIGKLFEGPVLAPTDSQTRARLGFPGTDINALTQDVRAQTNMFKQFTSGLAKLTKLGAPAELVKQLRERGVDSLATIKTILGAKPGERKSLFAAIAAQNIAVQRAALMQVNARVVNIKSGRQQQPVFYLSIDGKEVEVTVTKRQQRKDRSRGQQRRGNQGGMALAQ